MIAELLGLLLETTLATSAAVALVLLLRRPLRRLAGARVAYALWSLVPAAALAVMLPARTVTLELQASVAAPVALASAPQLVAAPFDPQPWLFLAWALGTLALAALFVWRQRGFRRGLGRLSARADGSWLAQSDAIGPAVIGLLRGRIVLPADFDRRYSDEERDLVLRHERVHLARGDLAMNLAAIALRCVYWFNPLLHYAVGRFRFDQELAADAAVLAQRPDARRAYADAMLKTQLLFVPPLGCHWQSAHPLKERIAMLKRPLPGLTRVAAGVVMALSLSATTGYVAWASQPAQVEKPSTPEASLRTGREALDTSDYKPPRYPKGAIDRRAEGTVVLKVKVEADGHASAVELDAEKSTPNIDAELVAAAREAALRWTYKPAKNADGEPIADWVEAPITFSVNEDAEPKQDSNPLPRRLDEVAQLPTYNSIKPPKYPQAAIDAKAEGEVLLRVLVTTEGRVDQIEIDQSSGHVLLDQSAIDTVRNWRFNPASNGYSPVSSWIGVPISFSLKESDQPSTPSEHENALDRIDIRG